MKKDLGTWRKRDLGRKRCKNPKHQTENSQELEPGNWRPRFLFKLKVGKLKVGKLKVGKLEKRE
jgi:hypothetical protein